MSEETPTIGVGMLGYAFMGKAHSNAYRTIAHLPGQAPMLPELVAIAGRNAEAVTQAADLFGFERAVTDWREIISDPRIGLFDNSGPNLLHAEPTILAAQAGKHVLCEKPLGMDAAESYEIWQSVARAGVKHMCGYNNRFVPAIRYARQLLEADEFGEIRHVRARYLQSWGADEGLMTWRFDNSQAGSGALGDLGAHIIDLARYLVGEITTVSALTRTFITERAGHRVDVDDAFEATVEYQNGAFGTLEATRLAPGRINSLVLEVNGSKGSFLFNLERLNELQIHMNGSAHKGFQTVLMTEPEHPFLQFWYPPGHTLGWQDSFTHQAHHLLSAIREDGQVGPYGADLEDGYRAAEVCDAIIRSSASGRRERVTYRESAIGSPA